MSGLGASNVNVGTSNVNVNVNANVAAAAAAGVGGRARYNTADYRKLLDPAGDVVPPKAVFTPLRFPQNWDASLQSYHYLDEFLQQATAAWAPAGPYDWVSHLTGLAGADVPPYSLSKNELEQQVLTILDRAADREDRFIEIIDQHDAEGCINYWLGMLMIDPARHPATYLLIRVAQRVGEMVVMCLKQHWRCPRPSTFCPGIVPMIDPPSTPSYPAGHALQSWLISKCLDAVDAGRAAPRIPQRQLLFDLATRIAENRVIAGIHFPVDNSAGEVIANACFGPLSAGARFQALVTAAQGE